MDSRGKNMFYQFISLDMNQVDVVSVSEEAAVRYFIHHATEEEKEVFLKQFSTYIKKYLEISNRDFVKDKNLMFEAYHLYDNYFPVLALFPNYTEKDRVKGSTFYNDIYGRALDLYWSEPANKEEVARELSVDLMKEIREYRMDRDFLKRKDSFLKMYGQVDSKVLKDAYTLYVTKEKSPDQEFFSPDIYTEEDKYVSYNVFRYAYTYALGTLGLSRREMDALFHTPHYPCGDRVYYDFCAILDLSDTTMLKDLIVKYLPKTPDYLRFSLSLYKSSKYTDDLRNLFNQAYASLDENILPVKERIEKKRQDEFIQSADIQGFIDSDCRSISKYCKQKGISTYLFSQAVSFSSEEVQRQVEEKIKAEKSQSYAVVTSKVRRITDQIIHGVLLDSNTVRDFDYLDYRLATNLSNEDFKKIARDILPEEERRAVYRFLGQNKSSGCINVKQELSGSRVFNINGVMHEVTEEEKLATMEFLRSHGLAHSGIERKVYSLALKRCVQGTLFEEHVDNKGQK